MTLACRDCDPIPKVEGAGQIIERPDGSEVQRMHNGVEVVRGGYYGDWMERIITGLRGHHEPQEERVFHELLGRIDRGRPTMVELGCFWAYYTLWFLAAFPDGRAVAAEPDPDHLAVGRRNAELNGRHVDFVRAAAGRADQGEIEFESELHPGRRHRAPVVGLDELIAQRGIDQIDVLHLDIQGAETDLLASESARLASGSVRFVVVSTHHHLISGSATTHQDCLDILQAAGGHVITEHTVAESYSGDGLIAASFSPADRDLEIEVSHNRSSTSLFAPLEHDIAALATAYDRLLAARPSSASPRTDGSRTIRS